MTLTTITCVNKTTARFPGLTYFFLFFIPIDIYPGLISTCTWMGNNFAPSWKRAVSMAFVNSGGNIGGIVGSNIFLDSQAPHYPLGSGLCVSFHSVIFAQNSLPPYENVS